MPEQDNSFASRAVPEVQNKAPKPPGLLPKNAQTWVMAGIAVLMVLVIAFSNTGGPKPKVHGSTPETQTANPPNQRKIDEYRAMVDEEARKLALERQRVDQAKAQAQQAAANAQFPQSGAVNPNPYSVQGANSQPAVYGQPPQPSPEEIQRVALDAEKRKREYASLFSSNVALSFRKDQANPATATSPKQTSSASPLQIAGDQWKTYQQPVANPAVASASDSQTASVPQPATTRSGSTGTSDSSEAVAEKHKQQADDPALEKSEGKRYRLFEGSVLEAVLTNRLDGSFSGPVNAMVTTNVYSHDHQQLLIPQGSRILGEVQKVNSLGQQRLAVFFHRVIMPDGYSLSLDQFHALNQIGETGLRDKVNHHYMQIFGVSLAIGAISGIEQAGAQYGANYSGMDAYRQGTATSLSQSGLRILDRYLNVLPTFEIREGHRIKIYLSDDLLLPAYDRHRLPTDL